MQSLLLLVLVTAIAFALMHLAPGGPLAVYTMNPTLRAEDIARIEKTSASINRFTFSTRSGRPEWSG